MEKAIEMQSACEHCGTIFNAVGSQKFCCVGCEFVAEVICSSGLGEYYKIRVANPPLCPVPVAPISSNLGSDYAFFDEVEFIKKYSSDGLRLRLYLEGVNCTACLWLLERLPDFCPEAQAARLNLGASTIEVERKPGASFATIARTLHRVGHRPHPLRETETSEGLRRRERRWDLIRLGLAGALTGNLMILSVSLYAGAQGELAREFSWLSAALAFPVLTFCAWPFYRSAVASLRNWKLNLDVPIVIAVFAGICMSGWALFRGTGAIYFDSLSMLIFLLLASRFINKSVQSHYLKATDLQDEIFLGTVDRVRPDGKIETISSLALVVGDLVRVNGQMTIPVDGMVVDGSGIIDSSVMTGETTPQTISSGSEVEAGHQNISGEWTLLVTHCTANTRLAKILRDTELAAKKKSSFVHFSDTVSTWFVVVVLTCAASLLMVFFATDFNEGLARALALIIVTCPCVFGIAIPLSMNLAIRQAARQGIVVKSADAIEKLWKVKTLFFDKTGTLTKGRMKLVRTEYIDKQDLQIALGLEVGQSHPVAQSLVRGLHDMKIPALPIQDVQTLPLGGVGGRYGNYTYTLRPKELMSPDGSPSLNILHLNYGLFRGTELRASFEMDDEIRGDSAEFLDWAREARFSTHLISGDREEVVEKCGKILRFPEESVHSSVSPEEKANFIKESSSSTAMIGDGANDTVALAEASVGIAVCGSLEVSLRAADVYLTRPNLLLIRSLFEIAGATRSAIIRNLVFSASFNIVSGTLAVCGLMTPLWAAVLMPLSSLTVLFSALWTGRRVQSFEGKL
jgi:heavy metal translocating P-type ATPase